MLWTICVLLFILWLLGFIGHVGWWIHSYSAGRCHHRRGDPSYSGTKMIIAIWIVTLIRKDFPLLVAPSLAIAKLSFSMTS